VPARIFRPADFPACRQILLAVHKQGPKSGKSPGTQFMNDRLA